MALTAEDVLDAISTETTIPRDKLTPDATLASLDIASLDVIGVAFSIEDEFGLMVDQDAFKGAQTVQDFVDVFLTQAKPA